MIVTMFSYKFEWPSSYIGCPWVWCCNALMKSQNDWRGLRDFPGDFQVVALANDRSQVSYKFSMFDIPAFHKRFLLIVQMRWCLFIKHHFKPFFLQWVQESMHFLMHEEMHCLQMRSHGLSHFICHITSLEDQSMLVGRDWNPAFLGTRPTLYSFLFYYKPQY